MSKLTLNPEYVATLVLKVRALMAREGLVTPDTGGNPTDDEVPATLQEIEDDLSREEVVEEIEGLSRLQQSELVALMWLGRGDSEPEEWGESLQLADERREVPTSQYLLDHPLVADYWAEGLDKLGYGSMVQGVGEL